LIKIFEINFEGNVMLPRLQSSWIVAARHDLASMGHCGLKEAWRYGCERQCVIYIVETCGLDSVVLGLRLELKKSIRSLTDFPTGINQPVTSLHGNCTPAGGEKSKPI